MSRKKWISIALCLCMVLALSACGGASAPGTSAPETPVTETPAPETPSGESDHAKWYVCNNLKETEIAGDGVYTSVMLSEFSGLKDKAVEESINAQIRELVDKLSSQDYLPAAEGLKEELDSLPGELHRTVSCYTTANINNILSIDCYLSLWKEDEETFSQLIYIDEDWPLNFDLNTGKQIELQDFFLDGVDGIAYIDAELKNRFENASADDYFMTDISLNSEFTGIGKDHKFYLVNSGSEICIPFDAQTPEFNYRDDSFDETVYYQTHNMYIDLAGVSAVATRFYDSSKSIFESDEKNYVLRPMNFEPVGSRFVSDFVSEGEVMITYGYPDFKELPESVTGYFKTFPDEAKKLEEQVRGIIKENSLTAFDCYGGVSGDVQGYGDMFCVTRERNFDLYDADFMEVAFEFSSVGQTFRAGESEALKLEDIFKNPEDCRSLLKKSALAYRDAYFPEMDPATGNDETISEEELNQFFDECYDRLIGFTVYDTGIYLYYDNMDEITAKYTDNEESYWMYDQLIRNASFKDLGCENLNLFE